MKELNISPDDYTYSILFTELGKHGYYREALILYRSIPPQYMLDTVAINSLLGAIAIGSDPLSAVHMFFELVSPSSIPTQDASNGSNGSKESKGSGSIPVPPPSRRFLADKVTFTILFRCLDLARHGTTMDHVDFYGSAPMALPGNIDMEKVDGVDMVAVMERDRTLRLIDAISNLPFPFLRYQGVGSGRKDDRNRDVRREVKIVATGIAMEERQRARVRTEPSEVRDKAAIIEDVEMSNSPISPISPIPITNNNIDKLLRMLFKSMVFEYRISPDRVMLTVLNALFTTESRNPRHYKGRGKTLPLPLPQRDGDGVTPQSLGREKGTPQNLSRETGRLIFEELVAAGFHPSMMEDLLRGSGYSPVQVEKLLTDDSALDSLQGYVSRSSSRLFKKYGWNSVDSGWSPFF